MSHLDGWIPRVDVILFSFRMYPSYLSVHLRNVFPFSDYSILCQITICVSGILHCCVVRISVTEYVWCLFIFEPVALIRSICLALLLMFCKQSLKEFYFAIKTLFETGNNHINPSLWQNCFVIHIFDRCIEYCHGPYPQIYVKCFTTFIHTPVVDVHFDP
jgi:hypothetical protein